MRRPHPGEGARKPEARYHPEGAAVDAPGIWHEGHASYPGRSASLPFATGIERCRDGLAEVSRGCNSRPDQTMKGQTCQSVHDGYSDCLGQMPRTRALKPVSSGRNL